MAIDVFETKERILADNEQEAALIRERLSGTGTVFVNLMGSPGAGKTSALLNLIGLLAGRCRIGIIEADVDSDVDARKIAETGAKVIQVHTAGLCHMDADMTSRALGHLGVEGLDLIFLENIGNLVCPAEFEIGADVKLMILSVPEGDDKPLKYPLMFSVSDILLINKIDAAPAFDFDLAKASERARKLNPGIKVFPVSAREGQGFEELAGILLGMVLEKKGGRNENH